MNERDRGRGRDEDGEAEGPVEIAFVGDLTDNSAEIADKLVGVPMGGECTLYIDSPGGSPYSALSLMTIMRVRELQATGIVTGECSSAALWPFAVCVRRIVTPYSVLLLHPMRWQSEEHVQFAEAAEWARHFQHLEKQMDHLLADALGMSLEKLLPWMQPGRYLSGEEFAAVGLAELIDPFQLPPRSHRSED